MTEPVNYKVDYTRDDIIQLYTKEWVMEWCKKYHPETFTKAKNFITEQLMIKSVQKDKKKVVEGE
tara:strand:- start:589 stop:783 length:195 start_codon:yes stop_codon:yes gene_type:complete